METTGPAKTITLWHAPNFMDAVMLKGQFAGHHYPPHTRDTHCLGVIGRRLMMRRFCRRLRVLQVPYTPSPPTRKMPAVNLTRSNTWQEISINRVGPC